MNARPDAETAAAIAAALAAILRAARPARAPATPAWRLAARVDGVADAPAARALHGGSRWSRAGRRAAR